MSKKIIVTVNEGKIRGIKKQSKFFSTEYYSFFGVPYGQSTAKQSRFKDPVKAKAWENVLDATVEKEGCLQYSLRLQRVSGSEDCLYNNIHTPQLSSGGDSLRPVIVNLHPGGYNQGSPETWYYGSPDYIMNQNIVYVCTAYRLHILGFLNLEMEECSGNQGLKDIILSLQWLRENIRCFGGDPNNITLLGSSSGAEIVHRIMLSPTAEGYFHKVVIMGGYAFLPLINAREKNIGLAIETARMYGYNVAGMDENNMSVSNKKKLLACLKKFTLETFVTSRPEKEMNRKLFTAFPCSPFMPTVDFGENAIIPVHYRNLTMSMARVPIIFGICEKEAVMGFCRGLKTATMENFYTSYKQNHWGWGRNINDKNDKLIKEKINSFYLKNTQIEFAPLTLKIDIQTDAAYSDVYNTLLDVIAEDLPSSVYVYKFQFEGNACTMKDRIEMLLDQPVEGTFHSADFSYWACIKDHWGIVNKQMDPKTKQTIEKITKLISTFARTGDPNYEGFDVQWKPSTLQHPCYLNINDRFQLMDGKLNGQRMEFWENLIKEFSEDLIQTNNI